MKCKLQSLKHRRQVLSIVILFKFIHYNANYHCKFNLAVPKSACRPNKLSINSHGTQLSSLFLLKMAKPWNCQPPDITSLENLTAFKSVSKLIRIKFNTVLTAMERAAKSHVSEEECPLVTCITILFHVLILAHCIFIETAMYCSSSVLHRFWCLFLLYKVR